MGRRSSTRSQHASQRAVGRSTRRQTSTGSKDVVRPIGRPSALTDQVEETILGMLIQGNSIDAACALAGIHPATFHRWMQRGDDARETLDATGSLPEEEERFRDFREAVLDARAQAESKAVSIVMKAMNGGFVTSEEPAFDLNGAPIYDEQGRLVYKRTMTAPDGRLAMQYLQRARPKDWSMAAANVNVKAEVSGPGGGPVEVHHTADEIGNLSSRLIEVAQMFEAEEDEMLAIEQGSDEGSGDIVEGEWEES